MKYLHYEWSDIGPEDIIEVTLDKQAHIRLIEDHEFSKYHRGNSYDFRGGQALVSPVHISPPHRGHWHLVIDLEGYMGSVNVSVRVI